MQKLWKNIDYISSLNQAKHKLQLTFFVNVQRTYIISSAHKPENTFTDKIYKTIILFQQSISLI